MINQFHVNLIKYMFFKSKFFTKTHLDGKVDWEPAEHSWRVSFRYNACNANKNKIKQNNNCTFF